MTTVEPSLPFEAVTLGVSGAAKLSPSALAVADGPETLSYGELERRATSLAVRLNASGLRAGDLVAICMTRSTAQITAMLAVWKAGSACLPIDPEWPDERTEYMITDAGCAAVIALPEDADRPGFHAARFVLTLGEEAAHADDTVFAEPALGASDLAYVIYTSGSTGMPKGVEISHGNLANLIHWHIDAFEVTPATRATHLSSIGFDAGIWEVWPYLSVGASVSIVPELVRGSGCGLAAWLVEQSIDIAFAPTMLTEQLIGMEWPEQSALRTLLTGADTLVDRPPATLPFTLVNNYGPTECTVVATSGPVVAQSSGSARPSIGRPIANCEVHLLDEARRPVAAGEIGELYIGGAGVGLGYRNRPELTAERFVQDPTNAASNARLYRTGDLASQNAQGEIEFHGRIDEQVKIRGHRVEPEEVAAVLRQHSLVSAAAVVARADASGALALVAYLVVTDPSLHAEAVRDHLASLLPDYLIPASYVRVDQLPVTNNGKLDKRQLPEPSPANQLAQSAYQEATNPIEQRLVAILGDVMNREEVGLDDNFFLIGGHSLLGTQIVLRAGEAFGVDLALRDLFDAPTARRLAEVIERRIIELVAGMSDEQADRLAAA